MAGVTLDDSSFQVGIKTIMKRVDDKKMTALGVVADELLRLSQLEVPLKVGTLMGTGNSERGNDEYIVGYNTPYAARLHEHPENRFGRGRKGKYLEDPLKKNLPIFRRSF